VTFPLKWSEIDLESASCDGGKKMTRRFTEGQIIGVLKPAEAGLPVKELCRQHGIGEATYYNWMSKYGGMTESEAHRLRALEQGKRQAQADRGRPVFDISALTDVLGQKL
jgi:putative transposase